MRTYRLSFLFFSSAAFQLVRAHAQVHVLLRLGVTLTGKVIGHALGGDLRRSVVEHDSVQTNVHFFRDQCNRFKTWIALALFNLNDGSSTHIEPFC